MEKIPIDGYYDTYEISNIGQVRNYKRCKIGKPDRSDKRGYLRYNLYSEGKKLRKGAHVLAALAFIPNTYNKKTVNHKNGIKNDNRIENLEWATHKEPINHAIKTGLKIQKSKKIFQYHKDGTFIDEFESS